MAGQARPGDFAVVCTLSRESRWIRLAEWLNGSGFLRRWRDPLGADPYDHAVICSRVMGDGTVMIVEARPGGAVEVPWHYQARPHKWSTGILDLPAEAGEAAIAAAVARVGYSWLDYFALAAHRLRIPAPHLRAYIQAGGHMICSQLVDRCENLAGCHLFADGRWEGDITPMDLANLLTVKRTA